MFTSIKNLVYLSFIIIGISLLVVILLGARHYRIKYHYSEISALSERTLFGFDTIREQAGELMISGELSGLKSLIPDIEQLNTQVLKLYDYPVIPVQYRLAMADGIDLSGLVIEVRKLETAADVKSAGLELQRNMRRISENLQAVDRVITSQIRDSVIGFQLTVIGTMGILISCASFVLLILYKRGVMPLLRLSKQAGSAEIGERKEFSCPAEAGTEIKVFVESVNALLADVRASDETVPDPLSHTVNETINNLNAIINYAQLLLESESEELSLQQREMITQIVESTERISEKWQGISREFDH